MISNGALKQLGFSEEDYQLQDDSDGAGVYINSASPVFNNCIITENTVYHYTNESHSAGGGVYVTNSNAAFNDCLISNNRVETRVDSV